MTRPILYISGPYSAGYGRTIAENIAVARAHAVAAARKGWMPFTPHLKLERDWAIHLNLEVYDPPTTPEAILPASIRRRCR